jgi:predicted peptidase
MGAIPMQKKIELFNVKNDKQIEMQYLIYLPSNYDKDEGSYPLVLFLHGVGECGSDISIIERHGIPKIIEEGKAFPFIAIAPQCKEGGWWAEPPYIESLLSLVHNVIDEYSIERSRVYGTGLSMGGFGTFALAIQEPKLFAAIVPVCGGAEIDKLDQIQHLPVWIFHGDKDSTIPVENSLLIYKKLKPINDQVFLTIYEGVDHDSWTETYENEAVYEWFLKYKN